MQCFCGNELGRYGVNNGCNKMCNSYSTSQICGGPMCNSVYATSLDYMQSVTSNLNYCIKITF